MRRGESVAQSFALASAPTGAASCGCACSAVHWASLTEAADPAATRVVDSRRAPHKKYARWPRLPHRMASKRLRTSNPKKRARSTPRSAVHPTKKE